MNITKKDNSLINFTDLLSANEYESNTILEFRKDNKSDKELTDIRKSL